MVGASTVGELGWSVENMLNRVIDRSIEPTAVLIALVQEVRNRVPALVDAFTLRQPDPFDVQPLADAADTLAAGGQIDQVPTITGTESSSADNHSDVAAPGDDTQSDDTLEITLPADSDAFAESRTDNDDSLSVEDLAAFNDASDDSDAHLAWEDSDDVDDGVIEFSLPDEEAPEPASETASADSENESADNGIDSLADIPDMSDGDDATADADSDEGPDPVLLEIFASEARRNLALIDEWLDTVDPDLSEHTLDDSVHRALHTLKGSARMAEIEAVAEVAEPAEKLVRDLISSNRRITTQQAGLLRQAHRLVLNNLDQLAQPHLPGADALIAALQQHRDGLAEQK